MLFYLILACLFTVYDVDIGVLLIGSICARISDHKRKNVQAAEHVDVEQGIPHITAGMGKKTKKDPLPPKMKRSTSHIRVGNTNIPKVLVQLPMYNEEEHCDIIIKKCCEIEWPKERLHIQVLDDSTKKHVRDKVDLCVAALFEQGYPVSLMRRENREGFKAGAMVEGLKKLPGYKYVAIFDCDFEPGKQFLKQTIRYLEADSDLGFVQTRWTFGNVSSFLTWCQKVSLDFHFCVEHRARSHMGAFFNFNGTAGVWRINCIEDSGGWQSDTVVEDMDLSLRAYLHGWKFLYVHDIECVNELPSTFKAYRTQQFRWLAGPMQIFRKSLVTIFTARDVSFAKKLSCYVFFLRYIIFALITVAILAIPPIQTFVFPWTWSWANYYFIVAVNVTAVLYLYITPFSIVYLLFAVAIGYFKTIAMVAGALNLKSSKGWSVTNKFGKKKQVKSLDKPYLLESILLMYYAGFAVYMFISTQWYMAGYFGVMAMAFVISAFGDILL